MKNIKVCLKPSNKTDDILSTDKKSDSKVHNEVLVNEDRDVFQ